MAEAEERRLEEAEADDPTILEHIRNQHPMPQLDPMHQMNNMVYRMGQEVISCCIYMIY
jgi:hypothetical protein